jgi:N utilization substance protein A
LNPAKLKEFEADEVRKRVRITVAPDQLSLAIGKRGQNARLTSKLTGWQVDIDAEQVAVVGFEQQVAKAVQAMASIPGITAEQADVLVHHGFVTLEALSQAEPDDLAGIPQIGEQAAALYEAARAEVARRQVVVGETSQTPVA